MQKSCLGWIPGTALTFALSINVFAATGDAYTCRPSSITIVRALPERRPVSGGRFTGARIATAALPM